MDGKTFGVCRTHEINLPNAQSPILLKYIDDFVQAFACITVNGFAYALRMDCRKKM